MSVSDWLEDFSNSLPTKEGWKSGIDRQKYRDALAAYTMALVNYVHGVSYDWRSYFDSYSIKDINSTLKQTIVQAEARGKGARIPDFVDLKEQIEYTIGINREDFVLAHSAHFVGSEVTWARRSNPVDMLNPGPEVHFDELRKWYTRAWHLHNLAQSDRYSARATFDQFGWITDVNWRDWVRHYGLRPRRYLSDPRRAVAAARSLMSSHRSLVEQQRASLERQGANPDDPATWALVEREHYDLAFLQREGWVDCPIEWLHPHGDPDRGVARPLAEVAKASAEKMKEVLAQAKQDANFTPATVLPGQLIEVQIPIYDRQQKGYRILNRAWTAQQRLAFVKHTLDQMSGVPIKAQELEVLSASGMPVPVGAVQLDYEVAWRCPLTGLFHDPHDPYFLADIWECQNAYATSGTRVQSGDPDDPWYLAHRPYAVMSADTDPASRYWMLSLPANFPDQRSR